MRIKQRLSKTEVILPKNTPQFTQNHTFSMYSEMTNDEYSLECVDEGGLSDFFVFTMDLTNIPDGEYRYRIDEDACGLIILGELAYNNTSYTDENNNKFIVYGE